MLLPSPLPVTVRTLLYTVVYLSCIFKVHKYTGRIFVQLESYFDYLLGSDGNEEARYRSLKIVYKEYIMSLAPSCTLCFLTSMLASLLSFPVTEDVLSALPFQIQNNETSQPWTEVSETMCQKKVFTLYTVSRVCCHRQNRLG